ncbi:MAG: efflux RND transporter periplasmic adaptor subunit [Cyclobacteriaceae bacterium]|nr:efflux RND transporter periplasmic adaptor subunit [Cyclobacteriaceae bacterium]
MNEILKNRKVLLTILIALVLGGLIGWLVKPSPTRQKKGTAVHLHDETSDEVWTCSMHPQIRQSEPGQCPICGMDLIPVSSKRSAPDANPMVHEMTPEAVALANIHTSRVTGVSPEGELFLTGKVKADERQLASVTAKFPGRIEQLYINFTGQVVRQGERLAAIYSPELVTAQKELLEAASSRETYPELYAAAREKLRLWKLTDSQIAEIENTGSVRDQFNVLTDKSGIVTQRNVSVGDYVSTGSILFDVVDLSSVWIMIDAYESDLPFIKTGDEVSFTAAGIPGQTFKAKVTYIDPMINPNTRVASVRAETLNKNGELKPEMFVNARIRTTLGKNQSSLAIPRTALLWSGKRSIVYVKVQDSEFPAYEMREITIGSRMGEMYLVEAGLEAGEEIVTNGVFAIDAAAQLSGNYSMLNRPETKTMEVPQVFREQITGVADAYFDLKNALVDSDVSLTKKKVKELRNELSGVDMLTIEGQVHDRWMALREQFDNDLDRLTETDDLLTLRDNFARLSGNILEMVELFGLEKEKVYKIFCPMAFDNKGAYWLSETNDIRNPYFGESMLKCGEVIETYRKGHHVIKKDGPAGVQPAASHNH